MSNAEPSQPAADTQPADTRQDSRSALIQPVLWIALSVAFVAFIAFGRVPARIWRFGELEIEWKPVYGIWEVQAGSLPAVEHQWLLNAVFIGSIAVFVVGVIVAMWLLVLQSSNDDTASPGPQ